MTDQHVATPSPEPHARMRYEFLDHLGSGGMADVYRARDTGSPIEAALARLHRPPAIPDELPESGAGCSRR